MNVVNELHRSNEPGCSQSSCLARRNFQPLVQSRSSEGPRWSCIDSVNLSVRHNPLRVQAVGSNLHAGVTRSLMWLERRTLQILEVASIKTGSRRSSTLTGHQFNHQRAVGKAGPHQNE